MQTITFYSYKGGVGRTLVLANIAKYLAMFGKKVFCVDFDLEAPGLHYKLMNDREESAKKIDKGLVDFIHSYAVLEEMPKSLNGYVHEIIAETETGGTVHLIPAGRAPSAEYWRKMSQIKWHDLFYYNADTGNEEDAFVPPGVAFFLELKEMIREKYNPDFLLIDSRTGVTEIGGIATTLLPDKIICLLINNPENLEGVREVIRAIKRTPRLDNQLTAEIIPVLTRIPTTTGTELKTSIIKHVKDILNEETDSLPDTLNISKIIVFHSDPELEKNESIYIGGNKEPKDTPLLKDYLLLCNKLVSDDEVQHGLEYLLNRIKRRLLDDQPDKLEKEIEQLWAYRHHKVAFDTLSSFYRLRNIKGFKPIKIAVEMWVHLGREFDEAVIKAVHDNYNFLFDDSNNQQFSEFIDDIADIWLISGDKDDEFDKKIVEYYISVDNLSKASDFALKRWQQAPDISSSDSLWQLIKPLLNHKTKFKETPGFLEYVIQFWEEEGKTDFNVLFWIIIHYPSSSIGDVVETVKILLKANDLKARINIGPEYLRRLIDGLTKAKEFDYASKLIEKFKLYPSAAESSFQIEWAKLLIAICDHALIDKTLKDEHFKIETIKKESPEIHERLMQIQRIGF